MTTTDPNLTPEVMAAIRVVADSGLDMETVRAIAVEHIQRMTVAREMTLAADQMENLLAAFEADAAARDAYDWNEAMLGLLGGPAGELAAVMGPAFVRAIIDGLRAEADYAAGEIRDGVPEADLGVDHTLAVARAVLAGGIR